MKIEVTTTEPYQDFLFALNSPVTRERYSTRLRAFFVHIGIEGTTMNERCRGFIEKMKENEKNGKIVRRWDGYRGYLRKAPMMYNVLIQVEHWWCIIAHKVMFSILVN